MNIGLLDVDSHNFPNLALMKISNYHKFKGDNVEFVNFLKKYDIVYKSKIFSYTLDEKTIVQADKSYEGGSGYNYNWLSSEIENICPDYSLYNCKHAYGYLTRGCNRKCDFCIVPEKEGKIKNGQDIQKFIANFNSAILLDNNVLQSNFGLKQMEKIIDMQIKIDFNQGLDARIIAKNLSIVRLLSKIKWIDRIRLACDSIKFLDIVIKAGELLRENNCKGRHKFYVYVLVQNIKDAHYICTELDKNNFDPFAMPYRNKSGFVEKELKLFANWVNRKVLFRACEWENFKEKNNKLNKKNGRCLFNLVYLKRN